MSYQLTDRVKIKSSVTFSEISQDQSANTVLLRTPLRHGLAVNLRARGKWARTGCSQRPSGGINSRDQSLMRQMFVESACVWQVRARLKFLHTARCQ
jgi:hypothetical protein